MRRSWIVVSATLALLLCWSLGAQAAPAGLGTLLTAAVGPADTEAPPAPPPMTKTPEAKRPPIVSIPRPPSPEGATDRMNQIVTAACTESWAAKDADTQKLVDALLADRKVMIQTELDRVAALEELTQAARGGDEAALKAAVQKVRTVSEKLRQDGEAANKGFRALNERLRQLRPAPVPASPKAGAEPKGANAGEPMQK